MTRRKELWGFKFTETRLKLLVFAPGVDPPDQEDSTLSADDERVIEAQNWEQKRDDSPAGTVYTLLLFSLDDERLIVVEEFAMCGDGRGVYLEHSTKLVEVDETFA